MEELTKHFSSFFLPSRESHFSSLARPILCFVYFWLYPVFIAALVFSSCDSRGCSLVVVGRLLIVVASPAAEHGFSGA